MHKGVDIMAFLNNISDRITEWNYYLEKTQLQVDHRLVVRYCVIC